MPLQYVLLKAFCIYIPFSHIYLSVFLTALALKIKKATFWNTLVTHKIYQLWPCQKGLIFLASLKDMVHAQSFLYKMASAANKLSQIQLMKQLHQSVKQKLEHLQKRRKERFQHQKFSKITLVKEVLKQGLSYFRKKQQKWSWNGTESRTEMEALEIK